MTRMLAFVVAAVVAALLPVGLTGCAAAQQTQADPCRRAALGARHESRVVHRITAEMDKIQATGGLKSTTMEDHSEGSWMWNHQLPVPGWGVQRYNQLQSQRIQQFRLWGRILVDNPRCFPAVEVAKAQEFLDKTG